MPPYQAPFIISTDYAPASGPRPKRRRCAARGAYPYRPGWVLVQRDPLTSRGPLPKMLSSASVVALLQDRLGREDGEVLVVVALDAASRVIAIHEVARGGRNSLSAQPAEVLRVPIVVGATGMVIAHNHPSGDPTPSDEDYVMTRRVAEAGRVVGVPLTDHVILTSEGRYVSMYDLGVMST